MSVKTKTRTNERTIGSATSKVSTQSKEFTTGENTKPNFVQIRRDKVDDRWQLLDKNGSPITSISVGVMKNVSYASSYNAPDGCIAGEYTGVASGLLLSQNDPEYKQAIGRLFEGRNVKFDNEEGFFWDNITKDDDIFENKGKIDSVKYLLLFKDGSAVHILQ
jgi:hypothetical protein